LVVNIFALSANDKTGLNANEIFTVAIDEVVFYRLLAVFPDSCVNHGHPARQFLVLEKSKRE
jgi:hypothetical protein